MRYRLAIFDMDGTILNTIEDLADSMNYCLRQYDMPQRTLEEIRRFVGNGLHNLVERAVPENTSEEKIDEVYRTLLVYYQDHCAVKTCPYEGIPEMIRELREQGVMTAVVSNKADAAVRALCEDYFPGLFDFSVGDRQGQRRKPWPDSVNAVLEKFGVDRKDAVYIGDSEVDLQTAANAQMDVISVGWGFRDEDFLRSMGAEEVIFDLEELRERIGNGVRHG